MNDIAVLYSFSKYDRLLKPLFENHLIFNDIVVFDDLDNKELWYHEGQVRNIILNKATQVGYKWALCLDPDERILQKDQRLIRDIIKNDKKRQTIYQFNFNEMFSTTEYRIDGRWGRKWKRILFPLNSFNFYQNSKLHSHWYPRNRFYAIKKTNIPIWHLKHIFQGAAQERRRIYEQWDTIRAQKDYSYLTDMEGAVFQLAPKEISNYAKEALETGRN